MTELLQFSSYYPQIKVVVQDKGLAFEKILNDRLKEGWRITELHFPSVATSTEGKVFFYRNIRKISSRKVGYRK